MGTGYCRLKYLSQPGWSAALTEQNKIISDSPGRQTRAPVHSQDHNRGASMAGCCAFSCKAFSLYQPCFNCSGRVPTAVGLAGRAGRLPGLAWGLPRQCCCRGGRAQLSPGPLCWGPGQHHSTLLPIPLPGSPRTPGKT